MITLEAMLYKDAFSAGVWTEVATIPSGYRPSGLVNFAIAPLVPGTSNSLTTPIRGTDGTTGIINGCVYTAAAGYIDANDGKVYVKIQTITSNALLSGVSVSIFPLNVTYFINVGT
jgi:hypothetical protein